MHDYFVCYVVCCCLDERFCREHIVQHRYEYVININHVNTNLEEKQQAISTQKDTNSEFKCINSCTIVSLICIIRQRLIFILQFKAFRIPHLLLICTSIECFKAFGNAPIMLYDCYFQAPSSTDTSTSSACTLSTTSLLNASVVATTTCGSSTSATSTTSSVLQINIYNVSLYAKFYSLIFNYCCFPKGLRLYFNPSGKQ